MFVLRLIRRLGLGVGVFVLLFDMPGPYIRTGMAVGAAIIAFFLPGVSTPAEEDEEIVK